MIGVFLDPTTQAPVLEPRTRELFHNLQNKKTVKGKELTDKLFFATQFLQLFGMENFEKKNFLKKFDRGLCDLTSDAKDILEEMDERLRNSISVYSLQYFPYTAKMIKNEGDYDAAFAKWKAFSYATLPCLTKILLYPEDPNKREILSLLERIKEAGLRVLFSVTREGRTEGLPEGSDYFATRVLRMGALGIDDDHAILFRDLLHTWGEKNADNRRNVQHLYQWLQIDQWTQRGRIIEELEGVRGDTFEEFVVESSFIDLQRKLGIPLFTPPILGQLRSDFATESIRADVAYLTALNPAYLLKTSWTSRPSQRWIAAIQIYLFYLYKHTVAVEKRSELFQMIFFRARVWDSSEIPEFQERKLPIPAQTESPAFRDAWNCLQCCLKASNKKDEAYLFPLLVFLLGRDYSTLTCYSRLFTSLSKYPQIALSVRLIYGFCKANPKVTFVATDRFVTEYSRLVRDVCTGRNLAALESLCFGGDEGTIQLNNEAALCSLEQMTKERIQEFFNIRAIASLLHRKWEAEKSRKGNEAAALQGKMLSLLCRRIFHADLFAIMLRIYREDIEKLTEVLNDIDLNIKTLPVSDILTARLEVARFPALPMRQEACRIVMKLHERFLFSEEQRFYLYLKMLDLSLTKGEGEAAEILRNVDAFIKKFREICPAVTPKIAFFLFQNTHKSLPAKQIQELIDLRNGLVQEGRYFEEAYLNPEMTERFTSKAEELAKEIVKDCPDGEDYRLDFEKTLMAPVVFAPYQGLSEFLKMNITREAHLETHLGLLVSSPRAFIGEYFHWVRLQGVCHLFLAVCQDQSIQTALVPLDVSSLDDMNKQNAFFGVLDDLLGSIFHDNEEAVKYEEKRQEVLKKYEEQVKQGILTEEQIDRIIAFLLEAKRAYRRLSFPFSQQEPPRGLSSRKAASHGMIYPDSHGELGSLIPPSWHRTEAFSECYLPEISEEFVEECRVKFKSSSEKQPLGLNLHIMGVNGPVEIPIFFSSERFTEEELPIRVTWFAQLPGRGEIELPFQYSLKVFESRPNLTLRLRAQSLLLKLFAIWAGYGNVSEEEEKKS